MIVDDNQNLIDLIPELIFYKDLNGNYTHCNKAFLKFTKYNKEDVIGKNDFELFSKENAQVFHQIDQEILKNESELNIEEVFVFENNEKSYFNTTKQILHDKNGKKLGLFCIARNITAQKEYEFIHKDNQILLEYIAIENNLKKIFEKIISLSESKNQTVKCSILLLDESGRHLGQGVAPSLPQFYNDAIDGIEIGDKVGSCGTAAFNHERIIVSDIDAHENWQPFLELTQKANLHACWSQPIISSSNKVLGTFAIYNSQPKEPTEFELKHISSFAHLAAVAIEKDKILKMIQEKNSLLMNKSRIASIGEMLENISHHWRQPLSIISTEASGIKVKKEFNQLSDEALDNSINNIITYAQTLSDTLDDFKKYSSSNNNKEWFNVKSVINKAIFILESSIQTQNISIIKDIDKIEFFNVENSFIHLILNILKNACDVLKNGKNFIFIEAKKTETHLIVKIKDSGKGIDNHIIDKIFDPYFTTKHKSFGTGSGLYLCKEIVETQNEGSLNVENISYEYKNETYTGALFTIELPI